MASTLLELIAAQKARKAEQEAQGEGKSVPTEPILATELPDLAISGVTEGEGEGEGLVSKVSPNSTTQDKPMDTTTSLVPAPLAQKIMELEQALVEATPNITEALRYIHRAIKDDPACVTVLSDAQRSIFFRGLMQQSTEKLIATASKKRVSKKEKEALSVDDFM